MPGKGVVRVPINENPNLDFRSFEKQSFSHQLGKLRLSARTSHYERRIASIGGHASTSPPSTDQASSSVGIPSFVKIPIPTNVPFSARPDQSMFACESRLVIGESSIDLPKKTVGHAPQPHRATTINSSAATFTSSTCGNRYSSSASSLEVNSRLSGTQYGKPPSFINIVLKNEMREWPLGVKERQFTTVQSTVS